ncbi:BlaI/MecI/CopY family transcriptional regulator [Viridibacillus sp. YIM B01967]|uniref:BlaI/MecI/CopY family transcriptional regulator n=1 Tax=Viridibacillus soli TaxID=2798301 RepID=A0ABS1H473_9BACL|nr:BlaI/MecI/CopY family transcriptional regulator [Viridibacillus soli]MBK3494191.1 BlaI/MecI/CopY family transcriptional regulator [Viridibacillus soli]
MQVKLFDSELQVMNILWEEGDLTAKQLSQMLNERIGWNKNTTYTVIKKCIKKEAIERIEPNFICHPIIRKEQIQEQETTELIDKIFNGSKSLLFASLLDKKKMSASEIDKLKQIVKDFE